MDIGALMARVVALRELAARATTPGEREAALSQAAGIVAKYQIDEASLPTSDTTRAADVVEEADPLFVTSGRLATWRSVLARNLCDLHGCAVLRESTQDGVTVRIAGRRNDVEVVRYFWAWLTYEIERLAEREHGSAKNSFRMGAAVGAVRAMRAASRQTQAAAGERGASVALVLVGRAEQSLAILAEGGKVGGGKARRFGGDSDAFGRGIAAGEKLQAKTGLGSGDGGQAPRLGTEGR